MGTGWTRIALAALVTAGCGHFQATPNARIRAEAESRLASCLGLRTGRAVGPAERQRCVDDSRSFCRESGLEPSCGISGLWTRGPSRSH